jgi:hypothetical protein
MTALNCIAQVALAKGAAKITYDGRRAWLTVQSETGHTVEVELGARDARLLSDGLSIISIALWPGKTPQT